MAKISEGDEIEVTLDGEGYTGVVDEIYFDGEKEVANIALFETGCMADGVPVERLALIKYFG
jgi:hypothetical protein